MHAARTISVRTISAALPAIALRSAVAVLAVALGWMSLASIWRSGEAWAVTGVLRAVGFDSVDRYGHQLLATSDDGRHFTATISAWCSTLGPVLLFAAVAVVMTQHSRRRRVGALAVASVLVIAGNLVRIVVTVGVGLRNGPGAIEAFHDGLATWFAVGYVLAGGAAFAIVLTAQGGRGGTVQPPKSPQMEATTPGRL